MATFFILFSSTDTGHDPGGAQPKSFVVFLKLKLKKLPSSFCRVYPLNICHFPLWRLHWWVNYCSWQENVFNNIIKKKTPTVTMWNLKYVPTWEDSLLKGNSQFFFNISRPLLDYLSAESWNMLLKGLSLFKMETSRTRILALIKLGLRRGQLQLSWRTLMWKLYIKEVGVSSCPDSIW